ncbi:MAG: hypothetical protein A2Y45_04100 [Tenericutes bacterium GWC2_34_14]|nr:MAG: hypothetical protein A2Y45_04100 [Tenericutes bacterium GWC2_34_14]OHE33254.1 MAG: hypothetical protein A2012_05880 [Tenericutes bacterium GWE2_34_108]OHE36404.1 MAG: hypothetical protein A2Y46_07985 [Tenericutes bacterium GWF1_35_14]OHE37608.1 MAG: hypothetical protein A2Y44_02910 [Tenericutes bacterium GWF2_35_184]OHE45115.1 MAG: hypothetical protein A2221_02600 [Tenericutes bacterium RIFOXYA2_FULL_36_32]OHE47158.1 MAG: hypothetical protein A3K26_05950 [Tenericutes bacterium RIFOXYA1
MRERKYQLNNKKSRYEIMKTWFSSLMMTVVAVVTVTVLFPKSPTATILKYTALLNEISFQVQVTDEEHALDEGSLKVILTSQLENYEIPIGLGETSGVFDMLKANTTYILKVVGSKGFGNEVLDQVVVQTKEVSGGFIMGYTKSSDIFEPSFDIDVKVIDPGSIYQSIKLYYGTTYDEQTFYEFVDITQTEMTVTLMNLFSRTHLYLEAMTVNGLIILDEMWITPPFEMYASVYLDYYNQHDIGFMIYHGSNQNVEAVYNLELFKGTILVETMKINSNEFSHYGEEVVFMNLDPLSEYTLRGHVIYTNPDTLQEESIPIEEIVVTTLGDYDVDVQIDYFARNLYVTLTVTDPNHYFQTPYVDLYDVTSGEQMWMSSHSFSFTPDGNSKSATLTISIPIDKDVLVVIGIKNEINIQIRHIIYDEIINKE